jgi:hypothetical protein
MCAGDYLTVIIMQHANFGTLWDAIKVGPKGTAAR